MNFHYKECINIKWRYDIKINKDRLKQLKKMKVLTGEANDTHTWTWNSLTFQISQETLNLSKECLEK